MNHLQEWTLLFLKGRERDGLQTKGKDLRAVSSSVSTQDIVQLVERGFIAVEQTNIIPAFQNSVGLSTIITLTDKGREYFQRPN